MLPVVVLTTFFPNPRDPGRTPFMRHLLRAMGALRDVHIVAPVPRRPPIGAWRDAQPVPAVETHDGFILHHPRYLATPGLHMLSGWTYFRGAWPELARLRRELGPFVLHAHCAFPDAVGAALAARRLRVPLVVTAHGSDVNAGARSGLLRPQIRWALRQAASVISVSRPLQARIAALTGRCEQRLPCIPCSGYASELFHPRPRGEVRARIGVRPDIPLTVFVGHLVPVKAVDVLIDAWALRRRAPAGTVGQGLLAIAGEGAERERLERRARDAGLGDSVRFLGPLPQPVAADWIAAADALCLPSHSEGSPNVVVEALASGTAVVATRVGGLPDLIVDGVNGRLVPPADPAALAAALDDVLGREWDPSGLRATVAHLTWDEIARRNGDVLATAAGEARS